MKWFRDTFVASTAKMKVLDVGSFDVNGSYKHLFPEPGFEYIGIDMTPGPNVDLVPKDPYSWQEIKTGNFDVVISGQALEHSEFFWLTMSEMVRVLKPGGLICIIVPNGFGEHRYPVDCWRFFTDGLVALARYTSLEVIHAHTNCTPLTNPIQLAWLNRAKADSMLVAKKPYAGATRILETNSYKCKPADHKKLRKGMLTNDQVDHIQKKIKQLKSS